VDTVERAREDEVIIRVEVAGPGEAQGTDRRGLSLMCARRGRSGSASGEGAVINERSGFGDDKEGEDGPGAW